MVTITGRNLRLETLEQIARSKEKITLAPIARRRIAAANRSLNKILAENEPIYGVNTGFGALAGEKISRGKLQTLQRNLILSHAVGAGEMLPGDAVRGAIALRVNTLAQGHSGVRPELVRFLISMLNQDVVPVVYEKGSVGASGDLAPLAFIALVVIGRGEAFYQGKRLRGRSALERAGLKPVTLEPKEGVALINGTQMMTSLGALALTDGERLLEIAEAAGAMSFAALGGDKKITDERLHKIRPHPGQLESARRLAKFLTGVEKQGGLIQDAYSLRCIPQVHGAVREALDFVRTILATEINSVTDNPLLFGNKVLSGGNFHGAVVSLAMDTLGIALSQLAAISERRTFRLLDPKLSGLPPFLSPNAGLNSGLMMTQVLAAALVSENKILAHPASVDTISTSANQEDYVNMGMTAALKAKKIYENARTVLAIELLCAAQALEMAGRIPRGLKEIFKTIRTAVPFIKSDRELQPLIEKITTLIQAGKLPLR
jgi:histidine ammonia-lyase